MLQNDSLSTVYRKDEESRVYPLEDPVAARSLTTGLVSFAREYREGRSI